jgi:hypothetical protein
MTQTSSNYTSDEIQAAVTSLVLSTISYPIDTLGVRRTDLTFNDVQQAAANIFILYPNSPFYVLYLGCQRLNDQITAEGVILTSLLAALQALGTEVLPVTDVSPLFNIQASLQALASAAATRSSTLNVTQAPAYQQFTSNVTAFLNGPGQSVKQNGNIVQTPAQARQAIPGLITQLQAAHTALIATVTSLSEGIEDYNSINLPAVVAESVLSNAAALVGSSATAMQALTPAARTAMIRSVVLNLLATNATVNTFGNFQGPSDFYTLSGLGMAYSDATHPAVPAEAIASIGRGYAIKAGVNDTLTVSPDGGTPFNIVLPPSTLALIGGIVPGPYDIVLGVNDLFKTFVASIEYDATLTPGAARTAAQVAADIQAVLPAGAFAEVYLTPYDPVNEAVRIRLDDTHLAAEDELEIVADDPDSAATLATLGFVGFTVSQCLKTTADVLAKAISALTNAILAGTATVTEVGPITTAHSDPSNPNHVVFSEAESLGNAAFATTTLTYTVTAITVAGTISTGDTAALRSGPSAGHGYVITTVNGAAVVGHQVAVGDIVVATGTFAGTGSAGVDVEFGPTLAPVKYQVVLIPSGPNQGTYFVAGLGDTAIDIIILEPLPLYTNTPATQPVVFTASFGDLYLALESVNTTTSSKLVIAGDAALTFFAASPTTVLGTTPWFQLPSIPQGLQSGDILEYYPTDYATPSFSYTIVSVDTTLDLIQVGPDPNTGLGVPDLSSWQFSPQPVPFAALRYGMQNDWNQVQAAFVAWLAASVNQPLFFQNFNALINPLLANASPTTAQVGASVNALNSLAAFVQAIFATAINENPAQALDSIVASFTIESVPSIDNLIQAFLEKGSDRATDLLLQGEFSMFFGLTADQVSYAGAFQAATVAVNATDLPVSKFVRPEAQSSQLTGQTSSVDFEFQPSSITETIPGPPPTAAPTSYGESSSYGTTTGSTGSGNQ